MRSGSAWRIAWFLVAILLLLGTLLTGVGLIHGAKVLSAAMTPDPVHICDAPEFWGWSGWDCYSMTTYYDYREDELALVGNVRKNGEPWHTMSGFSLPYQYQPEPRYTTAKEYHPIMGCPDWEDALELALIANGAEIKPGMA
jgi:hypothetical protein